MNKQQILQLKRQVHKLKPVVIIGAQGLSTAVHNEIDTALEAHELIKIRINAEDREQRQQIIKTICEHHGAQLIHKIGHIIAIYREANSAEAEG